MSPNWAAGLAGQQPSWGFDLPAELFFGSRHVRLTGIATYVESSDSRGLWQARVQVPATAECWHLGAAEPQQLKQDQIPEIIVGRARSREAVRQPDIMGRSALHNVSPIGHGWKLALSPKSTTGFLTSNIEDVVIDLFLTIRSAKSG
jgi:hypothetical protein